MKGGRWNEAGTVCSIITRDHARLSPAAAPERRAAPAQRPEQLTPPRVFLSAAQTRKLSERPRRPRAGGYPPFGEGRTVVMRPEATLVHGLVHHLHAGGLADAAAVAALGAVVGCVEGRAALLQSDGVDALVAALRTAPAGSALAEAATVSLRRAVEPPPPGDADAAALRTALARCAFEAGVLEPLTAALRASSAGDSQTLPSAQESMTLLGHLIMFDDPATGKRLGDTGVAQALAELSLRAPAQALVQPMVSLLLCSVSLAFGGVHFASQDARRSVARALMRVLCVARPGAGDKATQKALMGLAAFCCLDVAGPAALRAWP